MGGAGRGVVHVALFSFFPRVYVGVGECVHACVRGGRQRGG